MARTHLRALTKEKGLSELSSTVPRQTEDVINLQLQVCQFTVKGNTSRLLSLS